MLSGISGYTSALGCPFRTWEVRFAGGGVEGFWVEESMSKALNSGLQYRDTWAKGFACNRAV